MKNGRSIFNHDRKGIVDVQFNWIFVMIAGVTIFLFIISIAFSQKNAVEKRSDLRALNQVMTLLKDKQQSSDVYSEISFPKTDMVFRCENITIDAVKGIEEGSFTVKLSKSAPIPFQNEIIFAPQEMNTDKLLVWNKAFNTGFPVGTFIYVTTPDTIIIIYNDSDNARYAAELYDGLPDNVTKKITTNINAYRSFKNMKIICFGDANTNYCPTPSDYNYLMIIPGNGQDSRLFDFGTVVFHRKPGSVYTRSYLSKAGLYGAVFSDSARYYDCQMLRAMNQFEIKRSLVEDRLKLISAGLEEGECKNIITITLNNNILPIANPVLNYANATYIGRNSRNLDIRNENLIIDSCPSIY